MTQPTETIEVCEGVTATGDPEEIQRILDFQMMRWEAMGNYRRFRQAQTEYRENGYRNPTPAWLQGIKSRLET